MYPARQLDRFGNEIMWPTREAMEIIVNEYKKLGVSATQLAQDFGVSRNSVLDKLSSMGLNYGHIASNKYDLPSVAMILKEMSEKGITLIEWCRLNGYSQQAYNAVRKRLTRKGIFIQKKFTHQGTRPTKKCFFTIEVSEEVGESFKKLFTLADNPTNYLRNLIYRMAEDQELL